jgi:hypothetical protein
MSVCLKLSPTDHLRWLMVVLGVVLRITVRLAIWQHTDASWRIPSTEALISPYSLCVPQREAVE